MYEIEDNGPGFNYDPKFWNSILKFASTDREQEEGSKNVWRTGFKQASCFLGDDLKIITKRSQDDCRRVLSMDFTKIEDTTEWIEEPEENNNHYTKMIISNVREGNGEKKTLDGRDFPGIVKRLSGMYRHYLKPKRKVTIMMKLPGDSSFTNIQSISQFKFPYF